MKKTVLAPTELRLAVLVALVQGTGRMIARKILRDTGKKISFGTLYTSLGRLESKGIIRRESNIDRRMVNFVISPKGLTAIRESCAFYRFLRALDQTLNL